MSRQPFRDPFPVALAVVALPFLLVWIGVRWIYRKLSVSREVSIRDSFDRMADHIEFGPLSEYHDAQINEYADSIGVDRDELTDSQIAEAVRLDR